MGAEKRQPTLWDGEEGWSLEVLTVMRDAR